MESFRRKMILSYLKRKKHCTLKELMTEFDVSSATIHRDVALLAKRDAVERVRGGLVYNEAPDSNGNSAAFQERVVANRREKIAAAKKALALIEEGDIVFLDSSTTIYELALLLAHAEFDHLTIITNAVAVMNLFRKFPPHWSMIGFGGNYDPQLNSILGDSALEQLSRLNITAKTVSDKGFYPEVNTGDKIVIDEIKIGNMMTSGTFNENATISGNLKDGQYARWTTTAKSNYDYPINYLADQNAKYVIEALMLPQAVELETINADGSGTIDKPYLYIKYTIWNNAKNAGQTYEAFYNLATILTKKTGVDASNTAFNEGWQNTINITISPDKIDFDANVALWADTNINDLVIY